MASEYGIGKTETTEGPRLTAELMTRSIVVAATAQDPDGVAPVTTIRAMTLMAPGADGHYLPVRMSPATAEATVYVSTAVTVADPERFAVGDTIGVVPAASPTADSTTIGEVADVDLTTGELTLTAAAAAGVAVGDIVLVEDTEQMGGNAVVLRRDVATQNLATGQRVAVGAVGVSCGQARLADVVGGCADSDAVGARIRAELRLFDLI